ncbi:MAG TPA: chromosomal replication initiator protein DnaA [Caulobacteraceae bacterium]|nr:chromosomal replication initiator protein DnaA [Caulobacteraceae bacterium]
MARTEAGTPPEAVWTKVANALRGELGEGPFNSYVAPSDVRCGAAGALYLVTPTAYARDWFKRNAIDRVNELWIENDPSGRPLGLRSRHEHEADGGDVKPAVAAAAATEAAVYAGAVSDMSERQRPVRAAGLQERLSFDSFVAGQGNEFAYAMARQVATWADGHFNPVFFHGPYGYGKTHLLNAIGWEAQRLRPDARVIYLTAERFLSTFVRAVMDRSTAAFKEELRGADLLLIDDVQFIGGKASTQEELFHTLTALLEDGRRVVLTGDKPPSAMTEVDPRLRSHLGAGLVCPVEPGDKQLRLGVVQRKLALLAERQPIDLPARPEVMQFLADKVPGSIRELEGALNTLVAVAGARLSKITLEEVQTLLRPNLTGGVERRITVDEIQKTTADHYGLKQADLLSERRTRSIARPRQVAMYLCKLHTTRSYPDIGRRFGGRDHTTVLHGVKKIEELMGTDEQIARDVEALSRKLRG